MAQLDYWIADWNLSRSEAALLLHGPVDDMVDATSSALDHVKHTSIRRVAVYITGSSDIRWTPEQIHELSLFHELSLWWRGGRIILRIDQSNQDLPLYADARLVKDDEPGASTNATAVRVAKERLSHGDDYVIYTSRGNLPALEDAVHAAGLPHGRIVGYQYASPESNPNTMLPGTGLTLKEANVDLSVVLDSWLPASEQPKHPKLPPEVFAAHVAVDDNGQWTAHGIPGHVTLHHPDEWWEAKVGVNRHTGHWRVNPLPAIPL